jgi:NAD(P)-dependent dehydrogenase (short-subunit alcohol dehydrogenase family)
VEVGTAAVCFASMAALLVRDAAPEVDAVLDEPLAPGFLDELHAAAGPGLEEPGTAYAWAKRGVQRLVGRTAIDWGRRGGRICSISPGMIDTPMGRQEFAAQPVMAVLLEQTPLGREGTADEVAAVASFLLSDEASFVTGVDVLVDGGACAAVERSTGIPSPPT